MSGVRPRRARVSIHVSASGTRTRHDHELLDMGSATKSSLDKAGCKLLNSGVYATPLVSAPLRAGRTMAAGAKLCSAHQEILCATKGAVLTPALARTYNIWPNLEE